MFRCVADMKSFTNEINMAQKIFQTSLERIQRSRIKLSNPGLKYFARTEKNMSWGKRKEV